MGVQDFDSIFDLLDPARRGFLTAEQLRSFDESLHFNALDTVQVSAAIDQICGTTSKGLVPKQHFVPVLQELERRRTLEEQVRWDFVALDRTGSYRISTEDALMLFRNTHGEKFSMKTWQAFLNSRDYPSADISFEEIRLWLCGPSESPPCQQSEVEEEEKRIEEEKKQRVQEEFESLKKAQVEGGLDMKTRQEYEDKTKRLARRKIHRWEKEGLEGLLFDDGIDYGEEVPDRTKETIGVIDILDALEVKYDMLRRKLLFEMLKNDSGEMWTSLSESDQMETFNQLLIEEKRLRKGNMLKSHAKQLQGSTATQEASLEGMMGCLAEDHVKEKTEILQKQLNLKTNGKSDSEAEVIVRKDLGSSTKVPTQNSDMLICLNERYNTEKELLMSALRSARGAAAKSTITTAYCRLSKQLVLGDIDNPFSTATVAVGLTERTQEYGNKFFQPDRMRQELLANDRLTLNKGQKLKLPMGEDVKSKTQSMVDIQISVVREITWKHAQEREILMNALQGRESKGIKSAAKQLTSEQHAAKLSSLRSQRQSWRESTADYRMSQKMQHLRILQEGVGIYYRKRLEELRKMYHKVTEDTINASILADLQQKQDSEFDASLCDLHLKNQKDLDNLKLQQRQARKEEHYDCMAAVILGSFELTDDEKKYIEALEEKYDALRMVMFRHCLKLEIGLAWERLDERELHRRVLKKKKEEEKLRQEGRLQDMGDLVVALAKELNCSLHDLMGEVPGELHTASLQDGESGNGAASQIKSTNLLADLLQRFYAEQDLLIGLLRSPDFQSRDGRERQVPLVMLKIEKAKAEKEFECFDAAAPKVGLTERVQEVLTTRPKSDSERQKRLAKQRTEFRQRKLALGYTFERELDEYARPEKGDILGWQESFLKEMEKKQVEEREILLNMLQDPGLNELREVAKEWDEEERQKRLAELRTKRLNMKVETRDEQEENLDILEEAAAIRSVQLAVKEGANLTYPEATSQLLCELQDVQDHELAKTLQKIHTMDEDKLKENREYEISCRHRRAAENVVAVLTKYDGSLTGDVLLQALEEKYEALRDQLLLEALMKEAGELEWKNLTEKQRQLRLAELKKKERQLRREGRYDEISRLLGESAETETSLKQLMGNYRYENERKIKEKLARRQKRLAEGLDPDESDDEDDELDGEQKGSTLEVLDNRFEDERDALLARLRGLNLEYLSEKERQKELLRLKLERKRAMHADKFESAAVLVGLAERQQAELLNKMKSDRMRHEQLAQQRLEELRQRRAQGDRGHEDIPIVNDGSLTTLQEAVLNQLEARQAQERIYLQELLDATPDDDQKLWVEASSEMDRQDKLVQLKQRRAQTAIDNKLAQKDVLLEAVVVKCESRSATLNRIYGEAGEIPRQKICISLMADLQQLQEQEIAKYINNMQEMDRSDLIRSQEMIVTEMKNEVVPVSAQLLFSTENSGQLSAEDELTDALDSKYDTLREKLLIEVLIKEMGENDWKRLSEIQRQRKILEMKKKERRLRKEGRIDEINELMGEALKDKELLDQLLGNNREEQERKIRERLEKRKQRIAEGMTEEECDLLEKEEVAKEEEENRKKRNILLDLQRAYDQEKEALLRQLNESKDVLDKERQRQLMMARLKREQRRAKREEQFDAAALVLGLHKESEKRFDEMRENQEKLARERIAARLARRGQRKVEAAEAVPDPDDPDDLIGWQDALIKEVETKHELERELLLELLEDDKCAEYRKGAQELDEEKRREKLVELKELRISLQEMKCLEDEDQREMFRESLGIQLELRKDLFDLEKKDSSDEAVHVALLADLQHVQDAETRGVLSSLETKDLQTVKQMKLAQNMAREEKWYDNLAAVVLNSGEAAHEAVDEDAEEMSGEDKEVLKALGAKYDALRDKLLMEALMKEHGELEWANLTEKQRQQKLVRQKLKERQLRRQGRFDEIEAMLSGVKETEEELQRMLGETKADQARHFEEKLQRRRELIKEREEKGLSCEEAILDAIQDQEEEVQKTEEKKKKKNILAELNHHYEDEKAALLASLKGVNDKFDQERQRQLMLARMRREQKKLQREEKFYSAALLMNMAKDQEKAWEQNLAAAKEKQVTLAKQRLEARKKRRQMKNLFRGDKIQIHAALMEQLKAQETENALDATKGKTDLQFIVLQQLEKKHELERDLLTDLVNEVKPSGKTAKLSPEEIQMQLDKLSQVHNSWMQRSRSESSKLSDNNQKTRDKHLEEVSEARVELYKNLLEAVEIKTQMRKPDILKTNPEYNEEQIKSDLCVSLLALLQHRQAAEIHAVENMIVDKAEDALIKLRDAHQTAILEAWFDNLTDIIFQTEAEKEALSEEEAAKQERIRQELEVELQREQEEMKQKLKAEGKDEAEIEAALVELGNQHQARKMALERAFENKRLELDAQHQMEEDEQYQSEVSAQMVYIVQAVGSRAQDMSEKDKQNQLMKDRLRSRRAARRAAAEERARQERDDRHSTASDGYNSGGSRPGSHQPSFGLRREKTVVDVDVTDDQKEKVYKQLLQQQTNLQRKMSVDQQRQAEMLQRRLQERKTKRKDEAAALFTLGERQKTVLEKSQKEERERQISAMKERVARVKYERTQTMKERGATSSRQFDQLVSDAAPGLTEDEKMQIAAQKMQEKFESQSQTTRTEGGEEGAAGGAIGGVTAASADQRMELLRNRRKSRKKGVANQ